MKDKNKYIELKIDGKKFSLTPGKTILQAAGEAGIYIPTLCYLDRLPAFGGCRLCIVEIEGMRGYPVACTTPAEDGMSVTTMSPVLQSLRREIFELILTEHPFTCLICKDKTACAEYMKTTRKVGVTTGCNFCTSNGDCELQDLIDYLNLTDIRFPIKYRNVEPIRDNPFYDIDYNLCVLCGRCVRICNEERFSNVLSFTERGNFSLVGTAFGESQVEAGCEFCGACIDVCPTGSLSEKMGKWAGLPDRHENTYCMHCSMHCKININIKGNRIVNIGPPPGTRRNPEQVCFRAKFTIDDLVHHPERLTKPMIRKGENLIETEWEEAITFAAEKLNTFKDKGFALYGSVHDSLENNYLLQKFARVIMGSNHINSDAIVTNKQSALTIQGFIRRNRIAKVSEIANTDMVLVLGSDLSVSHPLLENSLRKFSSAGKPLYAINLVPGRHSAFCTDEILINTGSFSPCLEWLVKLSSGPDKNIASGGPGPGKKQLKQLEEIAAVLNRAGKLIIICGDDVFCDNSPSNNFLYIEQLITLRKKGTSILLPMGHGSFETAWFSGLHPLLLPGYALNTGQAADLWEKNWEINLPGEEGLDTGECLDAMAKGNIKSLMIIGNMAPHPAFDKLEFILQFSMFRNALTEKADVVFPALFFTETSGHSINIEERFTKYAKVIDPPHRMMADTFEVISKIAVKMGNEDFSYKKIINVFNEIKRFTGLKFAPAPDFNYQADPKKNDRKIPKGKFPLYLGKNQFRYLGNDMFDIIPDIIKVWHTGKLMVSKHVAGKLNIKDDDIIRLKSGKAKCECRAIVSKDLQNGTLILNAGKDQWKLNGESLPLPGNLMAVELEKVKR